MTLNLQSPSDAKLISAMASVSHGFRPSGPQGHGHSPFDAPASLPLPSNAPLSSAVAHQRRSSPVLPASSSHSSDSVAQNPALAPSIRGEREPSQTRRHHEQALLPAMNVSPEPCRLSPASPVEQRSSLSSDDVATHHRARIAPLVQRVWYR